MEISQRSPGLFELPESGDGLYRRDAGELLGEVVGVAGAVVFGMQEAVDVIEGIYYLT